MVTKAPRFARAKPPYDAPEVAEILRPLLRVARMKYRHAWVDLQREIHDFGFQSHYTGQGEFVTIVQQLLSQLSSDKRIALIGRWRDAHGRPDFSDDVILERYAHFAAEMLVERASTAALRTMNWD